MHQSSEIMPRPGINVSLINTASSSNLGSIARYHPRALANCILHNRQHTPSIEKI
jgi:hypothetical protein